MEAAGNYIAGEWLESTQAAEDINPSNTGDVVGLFARADAKATGARDRRGEGRRFPRGRAGRSSSATTS